MTKKQFNTPVTIDDKTFDRGDKITIGGKGKYALSAEDAASIEKTFGTYTGKSSPAPATSIKIADLDDPLVKDAIEVAVNSAVEAVDTEAVKTLESVESLLSTLTADNRDAILGDIENMLSAPNE